MTRKLTAEQVQELVAEYLNDESVTIRQLADKYGVRRRSISCLLRNRGVQIRMQRRMTNDEKKEILRRYRNRENIVTIADETGWSVNSISKFLLRVLPEEERRYLVKFQEGSTGDSLVAEYQATNISHEELAKKYHVTRATITKRIARAVENNEELAKELKHAKKRPIRHLPITPEELFQKRRATGLSHRELADMYDVSESCIYHALARLREKQGRTVEEEKQMIPVKPRNF